MLDHLSPFFPRIYHHPVAFFRNVLPSGYFIRHNDQVSYQPGSFFRDVSQGRDVFYGDNQDMDGRHGLNVFKSYHPIITVNDAGRNLPGDNFTENTIVHIILPSHGILREKRPSVVTVFTSISCVDVYVFVFVNFLVIVSCILTIPVGGTAP
jgi:hypothetical protein